MYVILTLTADAQDYEKVDTAIITLLPASAGISTVAVTFQGKLL